MPLSTPFGVFWLNYSHRGDYMSKYLQLKNLREDHDLTQKQLADHLYMQLTQYRRYETGERELPLDLAISIAKFYDVSVDYIAGISDKIRQTDSSLTREEYELVKNFRKLSSQSKENLIEISKIL